MKKTVIKPSKARAVGVITPPLADMLALDEEVNTNHFYDVRVKREAGADNTYKGAVRKTQTIGADNLNVAIEVDQVTFYKEYPDQGWFRVRVYVAGTDTLVNRGNVKIYVKDADGILDDWILIEDYDIPESIALGWQITGLEYWNNVLSAFNTKNAHPFRCFHVKVAYTDSTHYYMNKTQSFNKTICYSTHPILDVWVCNSNPTDLADYENTCLEALSIDTSSTPLVNKTYTLKVPTTSDPNVKTALWIRLEDALGERIRKVPFWVLIQDTQESHTISGNTYSEGVDMNIGVYQNTVQQGNKQLLDNATAFWAYQFTPSFMSTSQSRTRRHVFTTLFFELDNNLFHGGTGLRSSSGFELRIQWDYMQPVTFVSFDDRSTYAIRNFHYYLNVVDEHGTDVQCQILARINGVTIHDSNDEVILWSRNIETGLFNVEFDYPYLHAGVNNVELKVIPANNLDYESKVYTVSANCPLLHYNISVPTILSGQWAGSGIIELEYTVGTIENDELPYCDVWDLKIDNETLVARDKRIVNGEWDGTYSEIVGTLANAFINTSYNASTGKLKIKFSHASLPYGTHQIKLVLPQTDAIAGGSQTTNVSVDNRPETWMSDSIDNGGTYIGWDVTLYRSDNDNTIPSKAIKFYLDDVYQGSVNTDNNGTATYTYNISTGQHTLKAVFEADNDYKACNLTNTVDLGSGTVTPTFDVLDTTKWVKNNNNDALTSSDTTIDSTNQTIKFNTGASCIYSDMSLSDLFTVYNNEFSIIAKKSGGDGRYELGFTTLNLNAKIEYNGTNSTIINTIDNFSTSSGGEVQYDRYNEFTFEKNGTNIIMYFCQGGNTYKTITIPIGTADLNNYYFYVKSYRSENLYITQNTSLIEYPSKSGGS